MYNSNEYNDQEYNQSNVAEMNPVYSQSAFPKTESQLIVWQPLGSITMNLTSASFPPVSDVYQLTYPSTY